MSCTRQNTEAAQILRQIAASPFLVPKWACDLCSGGACRYRTDRAVQYLFKERLCFNVGRVSWKISSFDDACAARRICPSGFPAAAVPARLKPPQPAQKPRKMHGRLSLHCSLYDSLRCFILTTAQPMLHMLFSKGELNGLYSI